MEKIVRNPGDEFYRKLLKDYYVLTRDGQYLFASTQAGRRPDRAFYMVPEDYKLGKGQQTFDYRIGKVVYEEALAYLKDAKCIVQDVVQGEPGYETGLQITTSIENPHSAYIAWMGKLMTFPRKIGVKKSCFNYIIPEPLPAERVARIRDVWPEYDPKVPLTLYNFMEMYSDIRKVVSLSVDYFGGAFKKPNLTMVWNRAEQDGLVSYHAGCTRDRVMKGLSGTGKTTLTVGPELEQDDALLGKLTRGVVQLIGLEAASFAKSQGLEEKSPEWSGLMKSTKGGLVLAMNIDCEDVEYRMEKIDGFEVKVPHATRRGGALKCTEYNKSKTTNGRFVFSFKELNGDWGKTKNKFLKTTALSFKRYDVLEPNFRVTDPVMAVALDSACESIITSAIEGQKVGKRVRSYAATDFMAGEQSRQALLKWKIYEGLGLGLKGKLVFFINNAGYVGESDIEGVNTEKGEKIKVEDSKKLIDLVEHREIKNWLKHPAYGYLIPAPRELEEKHGMKDFGKRFNLLNFYTAREIRDFWRRDIEERTSFLKNLFKGQEGEAELRPVMNVWKKCEVPSAAEIEKFYRENY